MTIELEQLLKPEKLAKLREEAERQHVALDELVRGALEDYIDDLDGDDTPDDIVLGHLNKAVDDVNAGRTRPAREALADLRKKLADADR
jgi:DNA-binding protein Fis